MPRDIVARLRDIADARRGKNGADAPLGRQCREAAKEIERLRIENAELNACFSAATADWTFSQVNKVITDAKAYVTRADE